MFCSNCGKQLPDGSQFCGQCGTPTAQPKPEPQPEPQPQYQAPQYQAPQYQPPQPQYQAPQYQQPQYQYQPPQPTKKSGGSKVALIIVLAVFLVGALIGGVLLAPTLLASTTTLAEIHDFDGWPNAYLTLYDGAESQRSAYTNDEDTAEKIWETICDLPLKTTKKTGQQLLKSNSYDYCMDLVFVEDDRSFQVYCYDNGVVELCDSQEEQWYAFTDGEALYEALLAYLPEEISLDDCIPPMEWKYCSMYIRDSAGNAAVEVFLDNPADIAMIVESVRALSADTGTFQYSEDASHVELFLHSASSDYIYYLNVSSDGYGSVEAPNWTYQVHSSSLYNKLFDLVIFNRQ
jgi:hypothetical protein